MIVRLGMVAANLLVTSVAAAPVHYRCGDGTTLVATFTEPNAVHGSAQLVFGPGKPRIRLPQVLSADGGRYAEGSMEFWVKGEHATLTRDGTSQDCRTTGRRP